MGDLITALRRTAKFISVNHALLIGEGREDIQQRHAEAAENALGEARAAISKPDT